MGKEKRLFGGTRNELATRSTAIFQRRGVSFYGLPLFNPGETKLPFVLNIQGIEKISHRQNGAVEQAFAASGSSTQQKALTGWFFRRKLARLLGQDRKSVV